MKQNAYSEEVPRPQNALDIFAGEWASKLPPPFDELTAGQALLFDDKRLAWAIEQIGASKEGERWSSVRSKAGTLTCSTEPARQTCSRSRRTRERI